MLVLQDLPPKDKIIVSTDHKNTTIYNRIPIPKEEYLSSIVFTEIIGNQVDASKLINLTVN